RARPSPSAGDCMPVDRGPRKAGRQRRSPSLDLASSSRLEPDRPAHRRMTTPLVPTSPDFLRLQARRDVHGGLVFRGRQRSYAEVAAAVEELARWLARRGVGAGQRVGVMAANEPALVVTLFALWGLGAVAVPI